MPNNSGMSNEELKFLKGQESIVILEVLHVLSFSVGAGFFSFFFLPQTWNWVETCTKQDSRDYSHQSEPQKEGQKQVFSKVNTENRKVLSQPADAHMYLFLNRQCTCAQNV